MVKASIRQLAKHIEWQTGVKTRPVERVNGEGLLKLLSTQKQAGPDDRQTPYFDLWQEGAIAFADDDTASCPSASAQMLLPLELLYVGADSLDIVTPAAVSAIMAGGGRQVRATLNYHDVWQRLYKLGVRNSGHVEVVYSDRLKLALFSFALTANVPLNNCKICE